MPKSKATATDSDFPKLAQPAQRALRSAGLLSLQSLTRVSEAELLQLHGIGQSALRQLRQALAERGWSFRAAQPNPPRKPSPASARVGANQTVRTHLDHIFSEDRQRQGAAFSELMRLTEAPVDWAYAAWDELLAGLAHPDNHVRAIAAQVLANLAKSDPQGRMLKDFEALLAVTRDERFVTARHALQALWKVGLGGRNYQHLVMTGLTRRFQEAATEKNGTLVRYDIIQDLKHLYDATTREQVKTTALALIETETDLKYRTKYASVWRK